jgi:hypothetical protein
MKTFNYDMPVNIEGAEVPAEFEFTCSPLYPATGPSFSSGGEPGGGGEIEIVGVTLMIEMHDKTIKRVEAPDWLLNILANDEDVTWRLGNSCDWGADDGPDPDDARDRRIEDDLERGRWE